MVACSVGLLRRRNNLRFGHHWEVAPLKRGLKRVGASGTEVSTWMSILDMPTRVSRNRRVNVAPMPLSIPIAVPWPPTSGQEEHGVYIEPQCNERLFEVEKFKGAIWDPACGIGRVAEAARRAGYRTIATDMIDRGYPRLDACIDFFCCESPRTQNIVCNPPFDICDHFVRRALHLASGKVAMIWLARRLNAARWLANTPLACIYLLTPRPSMPPGHVIAAGEKPGGGTQDFCWLVFSHKHKGPPTLHWLCRDGGNQ